MSEFNNFLMRIEKHLKKKTSRNYFTNSIAAATGKISIFLERECEDFGMSKQLYNSLMTYNKANRVKFKTMMETGCFYFEGRNDYSTKLIVISVGNGSDIKSSHVPEQYLQNISANTTVNNKRKYGVRGPGSKDFKTPITASVLSKPLTEIIIRTIEQTLTEYSIIKRNQIIEFAIQNVRKQFSVHVEKSEDVSEINNKVVDSIKTYLSGLNDYGGKYAQVEATKDTLLSAASVKSLSNNDIADILGVSKRRMAAARQRRSVFDSVVNSKSADRNVSQECSDSSESTHSSDDSSIDHYEAHFCDSDINDASDDSQIDDNNNENSEDEISVNKKTVKIEKENTFFSALSPKFRKIRRDKLDLNVVRDFCHDVCRLDTFATAKIFVRNYDGTRSYHQLHVKSQSLRDYYNMFQISTEYYNWQNENKILKKSNDRLVPIYKKPTIKFRSFTNAFCPCCLSQKQRDCANHIQINLINALKALGNLRRFKNISEGIKNCGCEGHKNKDYLRCPTSLSSFIDAVLCSKTSYTSLSADSNTSESIENQQNSNKKSSADKCHKI